MPFIILLLLAFGGLIALTRRKLPTGCYVAAWFLFPVLFVVAIIWVCIFSGWY
ncbi:hypothetical protein ACU60T_24480 [Klebsiella aerogenes]